MYPRQLKHLLCTNLSWLRPQEKEICSLLNLHHAWDLLCYVPRSYEDRRVIHPLSDSFGENHNFSCVTVLQHSYMGYSRKILKVIVGDESAEAALLCFGRNFLTRSLKLHSHIYLFARFSLRNREWQSSIFDFEQKTTASRKFFRTYPLYPMRAGVKQQQLHRIMQKVSQNLCPALQSDMPPPKEIEKDFLSFSESFMQLHNPSSPDEVERARRSLAFREFFFHHLTLAQIKKTALQREKKDLRLLTHKKILSSLSFQLTEDQEKIRQEINTDLSSSKMMFRIIQGEVGSGKTILAFLAAATLFDEGYQTVLMAPTTLLATQHFENAMKILEPQGIRAALLLGHTRKNLRESVLNDIRTGECDIVIGTHALLSEEITFFRLGLAIIDEQQRFGVMQRTQLLKGKSTLDVLIMTATPIPRTLAHSLLGYIDISSIHSMPKERKKIISHLSESKNEEKVYTFVERLLTEGRQAYFVYPRISEDQNLRSVELMYKKLQKRFPHFSIAFIHSRLKDASIHKRMQDFIQKKHNILVASSVIEVGIDVPSASIIVIESAQMFGLATLHQLRGRVGRGSEQSYAFFLYDADLTDVARKRLRAVFESSDGFELAEKDLAIRGPGDLVGFQQSGYLLFRFADLQKDLDLLKYMPPRAKEIIDDDPGLVKAENSELRKNLIEDNRKLEILA